MSWTPSVGVVGASYWSYMASVLVEALDHAMENRRVDPALVPGGVFRDAQDFFRLALNVRGAGQEARTPARMDAYAIAVDAVWNSVKANSTSGEIQEILSRYSAFLDRLSVEGALSAAEEETAKELRRFFQSLGHAGEAEAYVDHGHFEVSSIAIVL